MMIVSVGVGCPQVYDRARYGGVASASKCSSCTWSLAGAELTTFKSRICLRFRSRGSRLNIPGKISSEFSKVRAAIVSS